MLVMYMHEKLECFNHHNIVVTQLCDVEYHLASVPVDSSLADNQAPISLTQFCGGAEVDSCCIWLPPPNF